MLPKEPQHIRILALGLVCAAVVGLFAWMASGSVTELTGWSAADNHYNLLVRGFQRGQLSLDKEAPPQLATLADPYDPVTNERYRMGRGLHDMSYYKGRLYLYFGVAPALLLFWPWTLTGHYLFHHHAVAIFCAVGFLAGAALLRALGRRFFPEVSVAVVALGMLALGLATGIPVLLQRAEFWEVAVACGFALEMLALGALWRAIADPEAAGMVGGRGKPCAGSGGRCAALPASRRCHSAGARCHCLERGGGSRAAAHAVGAARGGGGAPGALSVRADGLQRPSLRQSLRVRPAIPAGG